MTLISPVKGLMLKKSWLDSSEHRTKSPSRSEAVTMATAWPIAKFSTKDWAVDVASEGDDN